MNYRILLSALFAVPFFSANAQYAAKTYAITSNGNADYFWKNIRQVNLNTGLVTKDILVNGSSSKFLDGTSKQELSSADAEKISSNDFVAASAYDVRTNTLFYSTMHTGQLRWINLGDKSASRQIFAKQQQFATLPNPADESLNITRMCIGADGNGYAMTNDATHLYQFTTGNKVTVTDLGNVVDAETNGGISIKNKCSSWGGDMVADAFGKLYIITASHNVFILDPSTRIASFKGTITGLPGTYTTNAAAVDDDGDIVVSSSIGKDGSYKVKLDNLAATKIAGSENSYSISDLANGNLLLQKQADALRNTGAVNLPVVLTSAPNGHVYPNPVSNSKFNVSFNGFKTGKYLINVTDLSGKAIMSKSVNIGTKDQVEQVNVTPKLAVGMYLIKVSGADKTSSFTERIIVN